MQLSILHPQVASRDCSHCQKYLYDEETGEPSRSWRVSENDRDGGEGPWPLLRPSQTPPPCRTDTGCPKGTPEKPRCLSDKNVLAYQHYKRCRATGKFPDDPIVEKNAGLIYQVEEQIERARSESVRKSMMLVLARVR